MTLTTVIRRAPADVMEIAEDIRADFHAELAEASVLWLFTNARRTRDGNVRLGVAKKLSPEAKFLSSGADSIEAGYDFIITISEPQWNSLLATQRKALLDHELCHCQRRERTNKRTGRITYSWARRGHDLEEFVEVVERHGGPAPCFDDLCHGSDQTICGLDMDFEREIEAEIYGRREGDSDESDLDHYEDWPVSTSEKRKPTIWELCKVCAAQMTGGPRRLEHNPYPADDRPHVIQKPVA